LKLTDLLYQHPSDSSVGIFFIFDIATCTNSTISAVHHRYVFQPYPNETGLRVPTSSQSISGAGRIDQWLGTSRIRGR
jgi:hypothetical protein